MYNSDFRFSTRRVDFSLQLFLCDTFPEKPVTFDKQNVNHSLNCSPVANEISSDDILSVSFSHHVEILMKTKDIGEVLFYLRQTVMHQWNKYELRDAQKQDIYKNGDNTIPSNFIETIPDTRISVVVKGAEVR